MKNLGAKYKIVLFLIVSTILNGCTNAVLLYPKGEVGLKERDLIVSTALIMLIVVLPAIFLTIFFAWKYHASNQNKKYTPEWKNSCTLEFINWFVPTVIIFVLSILVWRSSHTLDPFRPLKSPNKTITIQVVALDWKWLFIYPEQEIATVNTLVFPANVPIHFFLTSQTVMNSFFIPQLGSQIMTMAGMQTQLHLIANEEGTYDGISSNFSGYGFTGMHFKVIANSNDEFQNWVKAAQSSSKKLDLIAYKNLVMPSINHPIEYFSFVEPNLFSQIIDNNIAFENTPTKE